MNTLLSVFCFSDPTGPAVTAVFVSVMVMLALFLYTEYRQTKQRLKQCVDKLCAAIPILERERVEWVARRTSLDVFERINTLGLFGARETYILVHDRPTSKF